MLWYVPTCVAKAYSCHKLEYCQKMMYNDYSTISKQKSLKNHKYDIHHIL